ncbi:LOW QUALITY PROTEIN: hypothetical protein PHMEG_0005909 [Phytophthora megakarya]|uniref:Chromo domain-containing protein n=1 Tax=Phytophthora megakarya TaxID=4795 RepID=A0A225WRU7_9STRA|nr:LOW QUALITY PROTEIN: hypothetical protein PHMEG_0005909 [Phytophthora megakarya]
MWKELSERLKQRFQVGDSIWLYLTRVQPGLSKKFAHLWYDSFRILEVSNNFGSKLKIKVPYTKYTLAYMLKPRALFPDRPTKEVEVSEDEFHAALLPEKGSNTGFREYLVKWKEYTGLQWLPASQLNCGALLYDFNKNVRAQTTIRDWYAQMPKSTRHSWKLLSIKFKKLYCRNTGSYAE